MNFSIRDATEEDCEALFQWVNGPESLANKRLTARAIPRADHDRWFAERLADKDTHLFIVEDGAQPIGQFRFQKNDDVYEVDVFIAPDCRGQGLARRALCACTETLLEKTAAEAVLRARVLHHNTTSIHLFQRSGYQRIGEDDQQIVFELAARQRST